MKKPNFLKWAFFSRVIFFAISIISIYFNLLPEVKGYLGSQRFVELPLWVSVWSNFDGRHFIDIRTFNYRNFNFVYFPLYPLSIWIVQFLIPVYIHPVIVGVILSLTAFFISTSVFGRIAALDFKQKTVKLAMFSLLFFPTSFYYQSVYSESFFLLFTILSFYMARKKRWILAGVFGFLTTLTRLTGIALIPALIIEWVIQNKDIKRQDFIRKGITQLAPVIILSFSGIILYMIYLHVQYNDALLFMKSFSAWHREELTFPLKVIYRYLRIFITVPVTQYVYWIAVLEFIFFLSLSYLTFIVAKYIRLSYSVWMAGIILISALSGSFIGMPRYALHLFPSYLAIGFLISQKPKLKYVIYPVFILLGVILTVLFSRGYFVS